MWECSVDVNASGRSQVLSKYLFQMQHFDSLGLLSTSLIPDGNQNTGSTTSLRNLLLLLEYHILGNCLELLCPWDSRYQLVVLSSYVLKIQIVFASNSLQRVCFPRSTIYHFIQLFHFVPEANRIVALCLERHPHSYPACNTYLATLIQDSLSLMMTFFAHSANNVITKRVRKSKPSTQPAI